MKKIVITIILIVVILVLGAYAYFSGKEYVFSFSESQIYDKLATKLPLNRKYLLIFEVTLDNPRVTLINGSNTVAAGLDVIVNIWVNKNPKPLSGSLDASGGIKYVRENGEFFLTDPEINKLSLQGIPEKYLEKIHQVLTKALVEYYENHPIYRLKSTDVKHAAARLVLKNVNIESQHLIVTLGI